MFNHRLKETHLRFRSVSLISVECNVLFLCAPCLIQLSLSFNQSGLQKSSGASASHACVMYRAKEVGGYREIEQSGNAKVVGPSCFSLAEISTYTIIYSWLTIFLNSVVPFASLLCLNVLIIASVRRSISSQGKTQDERSTPRDKQLSVLLLMVSFTFLALTLPIYMRNIAYQYIDQTVSEKALSRYYIYFHVTTKLFFTNNAVNFFLYCMGGSKFRRDLKRLCRCCANPTADKYQDSAEETTSRK